MRSSRSNSSRASSGFSSSSSWPSASWPSAVSPSRPSAPPSAWSSDTPSADGASAASPAGSGPPASSLYSLTSSASPVSASGPAASVTTGPCWVSDTITLSFLGTALSGPASSGHGHAARSWRRAGVRLPRSAAPPWSRLAEQREHQLGEAVVQARDDDDHEGHEDQADHGVGDQHRPGGPDHLAKFADHLPEDQGGGGPGLALGCAAASAPFLRGLTACLSRHILTYRSAGLAVSPDCTRRAGGTRTPNHRFWRPGLWPIELLPCVTNIVLLTPCHKRRATNTAGTLPQRQPGCRFMQCTSEPPFRRTARVPGGN